MGTMSVLSWLGSSFKLRRAWRLVGLPLGLWAAYYFWWDMMNYGFYEYWGIHPDLGYELWLAFFGFALASNSFFEWKKEGFFLVVLGVVGLLFGHWLPQIIVIALGLVLIQAAYVLIQKHHRE